MVHSQKWTILSYFCDSNDFILINQYIFHKPVQICARAVAQCPSQQSRCKRGTGLYWFSKIYIFLLRAQLDCWKGRYAKCYTLCVPKAQAQIQAQEDFITPTLSIPEPAKICTMHTRACLVLPRSVPSDNRNILVYHAVTGRVT